MTKANTKIITTIQNAVFPAKFLNIEVRVVLGWNVVPPVIPSPDPAICTVAVCFAT